MNLQTKTNNILINYEKTPYKRFLNRINKWPSMPILQIHNKQNIVSGTKNDVKGVQVYSSNSMSLSNPTCNLIDRSKVTLCSNDNELGLDNEFVDYQNINLGYRYNSSMSSQACEITIDTHKIFESKESLYEQSFDASLMSFDESEATSLVNVLNTFKFKEDSDIDEYQEVKPQNKKRQLKTRSEITFSPLETNRLLYYEGKYGAIKCLKDSHSNDALREQNNRPKSVENLFVNDSFSIEYLIQFKYRLKEIRKENMASPVSKKPIHNGNRFSRVLNYCFLIK